MMKNYKDRTLTSQIHEEVKVFYNGIEMQIENIYVNIISTINRLITPPFILRGIVCLNSTIL